LSYFAFQSAAGLKVQGLIDRFVAHPLTSVQAIYSHLAKTYDRDLRDDMKYTAHVEVPRLIIDALGSRRANILDLGCGTGLSSLPGATP
jgi:predicted TPR repeat methyltransferase